MTSVRRRRFAGSRARRLTGPTSRSRRWRGSGRRAEPPPRGRPSRPRRPRRPRRPVATCTWPPERPRPPRGRAPSPTAMGRRATTPAGTRSRVAGPARRTGRQRHARPRPRDRARPGHRRRRSRLRRFSPGAYSGSTDGPSMTVMGGSSRAPMAIPMIRCALTTWTPRPNTRGLTGNLSQRAWMIGRE